MYLLYTLLPVVPLAGWYAYHYAKTGFLLGNPEYFRYNVAATVNPLRIPWRSQCGFGRSSGTSVFTCSRWRGRWQCCVRREW